MSETKSATEATTQPIAPEHNPADIPTDAENRITELETENQKLAEERTNYQAAYLKEHAKNRDPENPIEETQEEVARRVAHEVLVDTKIAANNKERDDLLQKTLKENRELKLAQVNKTTVSTVVGTHSENRAVTDTLITPEQLASFKKMGKDDKWIENYKRNLLKNTR